MFLDETIDPDIPTDPNELALYKRYGRNWRNVVMGSTRRDRGGNFDRGMRFMHSTPEGFMQRPSMQSTQQVQQGNIDQSGYFAQLQKLQNEYNQALQDYYKYMSTPQYDQMQDYYAGNYQDYYGGGSGSQDSQYSPPPASPDWPPSNPVDATGNVYDPHGYGTRVYTNPADMYTTDFWDFDKDGIDDRQQLGPGQRGYGLGELYKQQPDARITSTSTGGGGGPPAPVVMPPAPNKLQQINSDQSFGMPSAPASNAPVQKMQLAPAAPAAPARTMSDQFISRYERAEATGNDNPKVKTVEPVKTIAKPVTSFKTSKGNVGRK